MLFIQKEIENLTDAVTCIESNIAVQTRCQRLYTDLIGDPAWPQSDIRAYGQTVKDFVSQVDEHVYDLSMQLQRANLALQMGKDRKDIVSAPKEKISTRMPPLSTPQMLCFESFKQLRYPSARCHTA